MFKILYKFVLLTSLFSFGCLGIDFSKFPIKWETCPEFTEDENTWVDSLGLTGGSDQTPIYESSNAFWVGTMHYLKKIQLNNNIDVRDLFINEPELFDTERGEEKPPRITSVFIEDEDPDHCIVKKLGYGDENDRGVVYIIRMVMTRKSLKDMIIEKKIPDWKNYFIYRMFLMINLTNLAIELIEKDLRLSGFNTRDILFSFSDDNLYSHPKFNLTDALGVISTQQSRSDLIKSLAKLIYLLSNEFIFNQVSDNGGESLEEPTYCGEEEITQKLDMPYCVYLSNPMEEMMADTDGTYDLQKVLKQLRRMMMVTDEEYAGNEGYIPYSQTPLRTGNENHYYDKNHAANVAALEEYKVMVLNDMLNHHLY